MAPTQKQIKCVYALYKELGEEPDMKKIRDMDLGACSDLIDDLKRRLETAPEAVQKKIEKECASFDGNNFGMAAKAVMDSTNLLDVIGNKDDERLMQNRIKELYRALCDVRKDIAEGD